MRQRSTNRDANRFTIRYLPTSTLRPKESPMISRIWRGWTSRQNADAYERLLRSEIFKGIDHREILGYRGIHLLRRDVPEGVEFVTVMWFDSLDAVKSFSGEDLEAAVVPPKAHKLLSRFDARSAHYNVLVAPEQ
jgi:heme-degrading monooxygenase HmoA